MNPFFDPAYLNWNNVSSLPNRSFDCGFCGDRISSIRGWKIGEHNDGSGMLRGAIHICSNCQGPNFFAPDGSRFPNSPFGHSVRCTPTELATLYEEARRATMQSCFTGAVLLCRKMLMNIAVTEGADEGLKFIEYIDYLSNLGFIPPKGRHWVDHIRKKGNEATHEIALMQEQDAKDLIVFTEMLLKFIYEFPSLVTPPQP